MRATDQMGLVTTGVFIEWIEALSRIILIAVFVDNGQQGLRMGASDGSCKNPGERW